MGLDAEVSQLRRGDLEALSALLARYQNRLYRYLLRLVRDPADADDLFQQTWIRVAEQIRRYDPNRNFDAWLFTVARHLAIDYLRRRRMESLDEPLGDEPGTATAADSLRSSDRPALDSILERERGSRLAACVVTLPVIYREVLSLRFEEEMKLEDIADVLGAPLSTVKTRLRRGMRHVMWTLLAIFIPDGIGMILYFILRDPPPVTCPSCRSNVLSKYTFCPNCGTSLKPICPQCGKPVELTWSNCGNCGSKLPGITPRTA
ncbi:MAG: sigma-70 family RNA polymerase sigma factor [Candidatus Acidiferrales bacterium]